MEQKDFEKLFDSVKNQFDIEEPIDGHFERFEKKLIKRQEEKKTIHYLWKYFAVAAMIALVFTLTFNNNTVIENNGAELASVSEQMAETQYYFTRVIEQETEKINLEKNEETQVIINDAFKQLKKLESDYSNLKIKLTENINDDRIIHAMISNFQKRVFVLQNVLEHIENIKKLKNQYNETAI